MKRCGVSSGQVVARIYCHNQFPQIQGGGPKEPDLAQLLGWALSHQVSDSLMGMFTGVLMMRFKLREGSSLSMGNYIQDWEVTRVTSTMLPNMGLKCVTQP